ncbi:MAG TPA: DUF2934 domain-containing protein [Candidatus Acidoferrales bacterium]|jgi:hypothetical protein|nr:DUF2934 domain-containing protein [Candidatus Acidoferrales bacterium]
MPNPKDKAAAGTTPKTQTVAEKSSLASMPNKQASVTGGSSSSSSEQRSTARDEAQAAQRKPTREEVELAAYQIYLERGAGDGFAEEDWLQAERELMDGQAAQRKVRAKGV